MPSGIDRFFENTFKTSRNGSRYSLLDISVSRHEAEALRSIVNEFHCTRTLEIGMGLGASTVAIVDSPPTNGQRHISVDPFQEVDFGGAAILELERLGLRERVEWIEQPSAKYLADLCASGRKFDLIFIDGDHSIGGTVTDAYWADKCLASGGIIAMHDSMLFSSAAAIKYLAQERGYSVLCLPADSHWKRMARCIKYGLLHGMWFGAKVAPNTARSITALQKPISSSLEN